MWTPIPPIPHRRRADGFECELILDKIDFLLQVQKIAVGVDQVEPLLDDLLDRILQNPECWTIVGERMENLLDLIDENSVEILQFCMHTLRWDAIQAKVVSLLGGDVGVTRRRLYERVLESFGDDWSERELYDRYG